MEKNELYQNVKAVSLDISKISEIATQLKLLFLNAKTAEPETVKTYEKDLATRKYNVISWLKNDDNYYFFKTSPDANAAQLLNNIKLGLFDNEIGLDFNLKDKIFRDFSNALTNTHPDDLLSQQQRKMSPEQLEKIETQTHLVLGIYDKNKCFKDKMNYLQENIPNLALLDERTKNLYSIALRFPHFLNDSPYHFIVNMGRNKDKAPKVEDIYNILHESSIGSIEAKETVLKYTQIFNEFLDKIPHKETIEIIRDKANSLDNKNTNKLKM